jgi:DNA repair exonuclease SbcCD ATPase subunit
VRLFQISQLTLEYLLNVQDTLASNLDSLAQKYSRKKRELERTKQSVTAKDEEIEKLKRENRRKRKTILAYETMLRQAPAAAEAKSSASSPPGSASSPSAEIHVYVIRWFIGTCLDMTVFGSTTVLELKAKLQMLTSSTMPLHEQHISLKGVQLKDSDRLCDVSVGDESVLVLMDGEKVSPANHRTLTTTR